MPYQHNKMPDDRSDRRPSSSARGNRPASPSRRPNNPSRLTRRSAEQPTSRRSAQPQRASHAASATQQRRSASERSGAPQAQHRSEGAQVHTNQRRSAQGRAAAQPAHASRNRQRSMDMNDGQMRPIYVNGPKKQFPIIPIIIAIVVIAALVFGISSCTSCSSQSSNDEVTLAASDKAAPEAETITLTFAGDCTLGTDSAFNYSTSLPAKYEAVADPSYFFANVVDIFKNDDATIVNMEGTLTDSTTRADKTFAFKADPEYAQILVEGNVEAASLANNHSKDYGSESYTDTIEAVEAAGIPTFGYDRIAYLDVKGVKVALIGTYELAEGIGIKDEMINNINAAKEAGAQVIIVYTHWGMERETVPNKVQMELGHAAIDAGAHLVVGSHPHVIQGIEEYNGRYIVYSLGNFCFGGNENPSDKDCMIFQQTFTVRGNDVEVNDETNIIPCSISSVSSYNNYQPTPATGDEKDRILAKIKRSSEAIAKMASGN